MTQRTLLACLGTLIVATAAGATAPGDEQTFYLDQYRSVCVDAPSIQCVALDSNGFFTGIECPAPGVPPCAPDFLSPPARLRATMTVIADDDSQDDVPTPPGVDDDNMTYTILIEVHAGADSFVYANSFYAADQPAFCNTGIPCAVLSQWSPVDDEGDALLIGDTGAFVPPPGSVFGDLRTRLEALALSKFGAPGVPILTGFDSKPDLLEDATATPHATVAQWRIQIEFAKP